MIEWTGRSPEERALLNPSFFSLLLWQAATAHMSYADAGLPFGTAFLVLPVVLHRGTRESLPRTLATSMPIWLDENPLVRARLAERARTLVPYTKEALIFGGMRGFLVLGPGTIEGGRTWIRKVNAELRQTSDEVRMCVKKAEFLGRWFARTGNEATVMALMGVKP